MSKDFIAYKGQKFQNAFRKKQDKLPISEKERALKCMELYKTRVKQGKYYEEE